MTLIGRKSLVAVMLGAALALPGLVSDPALAQRTSGGGGGEWGSWTYEKYLQEEAEREGKAMSESQVQPRARQRVGVGLFEFGDGDVVSGRSGHYLYDVGPAREQNFRSR